MSISKKLKKSHVGELPLIKAICDKLILRDILNEYLPIKKNEDICPADTLLMLIYNLTCEKMPLYELEGWFKSIDKRCIDYEKHKDINFTDDRFGKALDRLYKIDRASLMTKIVVKTINEFNISLDELHNDSTTVCAYGKYPGKTSNGFELKKGRKGDHKPGLKQLIYSLSISRDGAVPIHYKAYPGNRNDDTTHKETWDTLAGICQKTDFLYVADCKLCSDDNLSYIAGKGGRVITCIPEGWH